MRLKRSFFHALIPAVLLAGLTGPSQAGRRIPLTLESAVDIAMESSYRTRQLKLDIDRTLFWLEARRAALKSRVDLELHTPNLERLSDHKWNSVLRRDEIVRQNTELWQSDLSVTQPVILFGYPTNGYISLNYRMYRYAQRDDGQSDIDFYNRLYFKFEQPLFTPNELKNDLEEAELNVEDVTLDYLEERVEIIEDISDDFYDILSLEFEKKVLEHHLMHLQQVLEIAGASAGSRDGGMDPAQAELEIANVRESLLENGRRMRFELTNLRQRLRLGSDDSLIVQPEIDSSIVTVDPAEAVHYGNTLSPALRRLAIRRRQSELDVENQKGEGGFHVTLELTYGLEKKDDRYRNLWQQYDNSNSATINAYIPLWDWGERRARIQAEQLDVRRRELYIEEEKEEIRNDILNVCTNLNEYYARTRNMGRSLVLSEQVTEKSLEQYAAGVLSLQDILQILDRHRETMHKYHEAYLGYRRSLVALMTNTYYDFEAGRSLVDRFNWE